MSSSAPTHVTESVNDRKKSRELAEARQSGAAAPAIDVKTGSMINPHNPEFITRRPWYLGGNDEGPSLDHQGDQRTEAEKHQFSLNSANELIQKQRDKINKYRKEGKLKKGMWVEALKKNKKPYLICKVVKVYKKKSEYDLEYEDGFVEQRVKFKQSATTKNPRIRFTKSGNRTFEIDNEKYGVETYDSKRDKYHGYDASSTYMKQMEDKFIKRDEIRHKIREQKILSKNKNNKSTNDETANDKKKVTSDSDSDYDSDEGSDSDEEFVQKDEDAKTFQSRLARQGGVGGAQMKVTARNLRIREDTAKYLRNLDINSAFYDPKSRSMRGNPNPNVNPEDLQFAGDNFARISGDAVELAKTQLFAWDSEAKGVADVHPQANPSQAELMKKTADSKAVDLKLQKRKKVLEKYGGSEYLDNDSSNNGDGSLDMSNSNSEGGNRNSETAEERKVRFGASVIEQEYSRDGRPLNGGPNSQASAVQLKVECKYEENIFINGHTTVWGSYFHKGAFRWGYADDHSLLKNSYCTGANGRIANDEANELRYGTGESGSAKLLQARQILNSNHGEAKRNQSQPAHRQNSINTTNPTLDKRKLENALKSEDSRQKTFVNDDRKRKYNSTETNNDVTEEEMEAYKLKRTCEDDPMAKLKGDELLEY